MKHIQKECPECGRIYNPPTDKKIMSEKWEVETVKMAKKCGRCRSKNREGDFL